MKSYLRSALFLLGAPALFSSEPVLIDFGSAATRTEAAPGAPVWNNVDDKMQRGLMNFALADVKGAPANLLLSVISPFGGSNSAGPRSDAAGYPQSAVGDGFYANVELFGKQENLKPVLHVSGLKPGAKYTFTFFASRSASDNRTARYAVAGAETVAVELDASNNKDRTVTTAPVAPAADGTVTITITPADSNNNANHFTYLGVMEIRRAE